MGMMAKMRSLAPWFIITVGGIFVIFMIISDSNLTDLIGRGGSQIVGTIDGDDITYQEFSARLENYINQLEQQQGMKVQESTMPYLRDQLWEGIITEKLIQKKIEEYGITVADQEIRDLVLGPNPPEMLKKDFIDSTGNFNRAAYERAIFDPRNKNILVQIEDMFKQQLMQQKLQNYVTASVIVTDREVKDNFVKTNTKMTADYIKINAYSIADSDVKINDSELKDYYSKHKEDFKAEASRKVKYVFFDKSPSKNDSTQIKDNLVTIKNKLEKEPSNFRTYVDIYSDTPYKKDSLFMNQLPETAKSLLVKALPGTFVGPVFNPQEGFVIYNVVGKNKSDKIQVKAAHILIKGTDAAAKAKIDEIAKQLKSGGDFAQLAREKSEDGTAPMGGDLGWFGKGTMVDDFWNACVAAKINVPTAPIKTQFGYHIIKVTDKNSDQFIVEKIINKVEVSGNTVDRLIESANDFSYLADKDGFEATAKSLNFKVIESTPFQEESKVVPGLGYNEAIVKFAFENSVGSVSPVFNLANGYAVVMVTEEKGAGYKEFDEVKPQIQNAVMLEKKLTKAFELAKQIKSKIDATGNFEDAKTVSALATVGKAENFDGTGTIASIGREFAVADVAMKSEINKISEPIKGAYGAYVIRVTQRTPADENNFAVQKNDLKQRLLQQKKSMFFNNWLMQARKELDVEDNRYNFYR